MATLKKDNMPTVAEARAGLGRSLAKSVRVTKAADGSPDSKGPGGIGVFGDFTPQNFTDWANATNPTGAAQTFDGGDVRGNLGAPARPTGNLGNALRQAAGVVPQQHTLPQMAGRVFKAFVDAEGREPTADDAEFFKAIVAVFDAHGEQVADEIRKAANGELEPVDSEADEFAERFSKALGDDSPTWIKEIVKRNA
jgi:hypothetical protein